jgi:Uma2 family endonuclease
MIVANTLSAPAASPAPLAVPTDCVWRLTVDQYHDMIRLGILTADDPIELLDGLLVTKMPKKPRHSYVTQYLRDYLARLLVAGWLVDSQEPVTLDASEPEPDVMAVRGQLRDYRDRHPGPQDVGLLVEVADSTLERDRGIKKFIYALAGIPVYWIVNLVDRQVEVYTQPSGPAAMPDYAQRQDFGLADIVPVIIDGQQIGAIAVQALLG